MIKAEIRDVRLSDFEAIYKMCLRFYDESNFHKYTFDRDKLIETINTFFTEAVHCRIAFAGDAPVGFMAWTYERYWTKESTGHLFLFYVDKAARGTDAARALVHELDLCTKRADVVALYVASTGGFSDNLKNEALFTNLFKKFGFKDMGRVLIKEYIDE